MEGLTLVRSGEQARMSVLDVNRAILKKRRSEIVHLDGGARDKASEMLEKIEINLSQYYQATLTKKIVKISEAMGKANNLLAQYDRFFNNETRKIKWQAYAREQYAIDLAKVNTIQVNSMRWQAWRQLSHIGNMRSSAANMFGDGQAHKAKKLLAKAKKLQEELHKHCKEVQMPVEEGFIIDPNDFNPVISKLEKSEDPLYKSELIGAKRARSQLIWLRNNYYQANKMRCITMRKRMREIEQRYHYLSNLKELEKVKQERPQAMSQLEILTRVKGLRKIEMGHIDVYCRPAGMGTYAKNKANFQARELNGGPWSRPRKTSGSASRAKPVKSRQPKITADMTAEDWQEAIDWAQKNKQPIRLTKEVSKAERRATISAFRKKRAEKIEEAERNRAPTLKAPVSKGREDRLKRSVVEDVLKYTTNANIRLDRVLMPYGLVGTTMKVRDELGGYYVFVKGLEATVQHCDYSYSQKKEKSVVGRVVIHDDVKHINLDKLIKIIAKSFRSVKTVRNKNDWATIFCPGNSGRIVTFDDELASQLTDESGVQLVRTKSGWNFLMNSQNVFKCC
jgi:hypothetical protein